jgi:hypothetical protein
MLHGKRRRVTLQEAPGRQMPNAHTMHSGESSVLVTRGAELTLGGSARRSFSNEYIQLKQLMMAQESGDVFRRGKYHKSFKNRHAHLFRQAQLRMFYRTSARYIRNLGWPDPLSRDVPSILLCGTASPYTTVTFTRFVRNINSKAAIDVLDIAPYALSQSKEFLVSSISRTTL